MTEMDSIFTDFLDYLHSLPETSPHFTLDRVIELAKASLDQVATEHNEERFENAQRGLCQIAAILLANANYCSREQI